MLMWGVTFPVPWGTAQLVTSFESLRVELHVRRVGSAVAACFWTPATKAAWKLTLSTKTGYIIHRAPFFTCVAPVQLLLGSSLYFHFHNVGLLWWLLLEDLLYCWDRKTEFPPPILSARGPHFLFQCSLYSPCSGMSSTPLDDCFEG